MFICSFDLVQLHESCLDDSASASHANTELRLEDLVPGHQMTELYNLENSLNTLFASVSKYVNRDHSSKSQDDCD